MILITGATGNVGSQIVDQLLSQGRKVRIFTRDAAKVVAPLRYRVEVALGDFTQPDSFASAAAGAEAIFMMNGALDGGLFRNLLAIAKDRGVRRIVFLSSLFAADSGSSIGRLHKDKEDALLASGVEAVVVRAGGFMSNTYQWVQSIKSEGVIYNPMGSGAIASIHPADIAAVAVHALSGASLPETIFNVTGDTLLTTADKAVILSKVLGRTVRVIDVPAEVAVEGLKKNGIPPQIANALSESYDAIRNGRAATITDTVERVTGSKPRSYESWVREHAARFA